MLKARFSTCATCAGADICKAIRVTYGEEAVANKSFLRGETFLRSSFGGVLLIRSGFGISYLNDQHGERQVMTLLTKGNTVGESGVLLSVGAYDYMLVVDDVEACFFKTEQYRSVLTKDPELLLGVLRLMATHQGNYASLMWILQGLNIRDRIERFLAHYCSCNIDTDALNATVPITHETLGMVVHAERATVSRALGRMADDGLIKLRQNAIIVRLPQWLASSELTGYLDDSKNRLKTSQISLTSNANRCDE